jgi:hypothetical protein
MRIGIGIGIGIGILVYNKVKDSWTLSSQVCMYGFWVRRRGLSLELEGGQWNAPHSQQQLHTALTVHIRQLAMSVPLCQFLKIDSWQVT